MIDGLALGETTPGPLIMIVTWVGYMGGVGPCGLAGATVATFFTFLPSFLFILAGGPLVEATRGETQVHRAAHRHHRRRGRRDPEPRGVLRLAHLLAAGDAAPRPSPAPFEWLPVLVAIAAFVALWKYKVDIMKVIGACALLGLAYSFFM